MPYIKKDDGRREALRNGDVAKIAGELNYQMFYYMKHNTDKPDVEKMATIKKYVDNFLGEKRNYQKYNDMTGALLRCAAEVKRRLKLDPMVFFSVLFLYDAEIDTYEDLKIKENGDVE